MDHAPRLLTLTEVATRLGVSTRTVRRMIAEDRIRALRIRGSIRIPEAEVDRYLIPTSGSPSEARPSVRVGPRLAVEVQRLSGACTEAFSTIYGALETLGEVGVSEEGIIRLAMAELLRVQQTLHAETSRIRVGLPQSIEDIDALEILNQTVTEPTIAPGRNEP